MALQTSKHRHWPDNSHSETCLTSSATAPGGSLSRHGNARAIGHATKFSLRKLGHWRRKQNVSAKRYSSQVDMLFGNKGQPSIAYHNDVIQAQLTETDTKITPQISHDDEISQASTSTENLYCSSGIIDRSNRDSPPFSGKHENVGKSQESRDGQVNRDENDHSPILQLERDSSKDSETVSEINMKENDSKTKEMFTMTNFDNEINKFQAEMWASIQDALEPYGQPAPLPVSTTKTHWEGYTAKG